MLKSLLLNLPRNRKKILFIIHDIAMMLLALWLSLVLRLDLFNLPQEVDFWSLWLVTAPLTIFFLAWLGLYRAVIRYFGSHILRACFVGSVFSAVVLLCTSFLLNTWLPRSIPGIYALLLLFFLLGSRYLIRNWLLDSKKGGSPILIYGAGNAGRQLHEIIKQVGDYYPIAFIDDNPQLCGVVVHNLKIHSASALNTLITQHNIEKIFIAIPSASSEQRREIMARLQPFACEVLTLPSMKDLVDGKITLNSLKKVSVMDLLGRAPVEPMADLIRANIQQKVVMVTGAGGSIGSELCRQIVLHQPKSIVLFELSEFALYRIHQELSNHLRAQNLPIDIVPLLGSVQHQKRLTSVMQTFGVQTIYHAAAYKHVPMVEYNTIEGVRNNIFGTLHCAQAAIEAGVETFVLISTDKAVRPTNTMGASKRMSELVLQALAQEQNQTRFCMVRFGNVLGSSGSVIPLFEQQIAQGGPITLTHAQITRYFMTIPEAAQLVIQAGAMAQGGDVFVLDMGESVKIMDLAKQMIRLSGLTVRDADNPTGDIEIQITGLRPGEKLYEELLIGTEVIGTQHPRIMTASDTQLAWQKLEPLLHELNQACLDFAPEKLREILLAAPLGFVPSSEPVDSLWVARQQTG